MVALRNVLVATDFSEAADSALTYGRTLARTFGATLHVVHVVDDVVTRLAMAGPLDAGGAIPELQRSLEEVARQQLNEAVREDDRRELNAKPILLTGMSAGIEIVDYAKQSRVDLIVIGTHGRSQIASLVLGSVADKVVRLAPCPVLAVRNPEHEFIVPDALQRATRSAL